MASVVRRFLCTIGAHAFRVEREGYCYRVAVSHNYWEGHVHRGLYICKHCRKWTRDVTRVSRKAWAEFYKS